MATKKKETPNEVLMSEYLLTMSGGKKKKVTVPADWKVTFGPIVPGSQKSGFSGSNCLRFYQDRDHPRAVFTGVEEFREAGVNVLEQRTRTKTQFSSKDSHSGHKGVQMEARITDWVDADEPEQAEEQDKDFLGLTFQEAD